MPFKKVLYLSSSPIAIGHCLQPITSILLYFYYIHTLMLNFVTRLVPIPTSGIKQEKRLSKIGKFDQRVWYQGIKKRERKPKALKLSEF